MNAMKFPKLPFWYLLIGPTAMIKTGMFMNEITMALNNGLMPVLLPGGCTPSNLKEWIEVGGTHGCMNPLSHGKIFADWLNYHTSIASLGDLLIFAGQDAAWPCLFAWAVAMIIMYNFEHKD